MKDNLDIDPYEEAIEVYNRDRTFDTLSRTSYKNMIGILSKCWRPNIDIEIEKERLLLENGWTKEEFNLEVNRRILKALNG